MSSQAWWILLAAASMEIIMAVSLKYAHGFTRAVPSGIAIWAGLTSVYLLTQALKHLPVGTAYAVWTGIGAIGVAVVGMVFLGESASLLRLLCIVAIVAGIAGLKLLS